MSIRTIVEMWNEGKTSQQIADAVGKTRNAVIGIIYRNRNKYNLPKRGNDTRAATAKARKEAQKGTAQRRNEKIAIKPLGKPKPRSTSSCGVQMFDLTKDTCRYPVGHVGDADFHFCGRKPNSSSPYCDRHAQICYNPRHENPNGRHPDAG